MITSVADERIRGVRITDDNLIVILFDGRTLSVPLTWYPRLLHATEDQRNDWRRIGAGYAIHWPQIDEDLSIEGLLRGVPAPGAHLHNPLVDRAKEFYAHSLGLVKWQLEDSHTQLEDLLEQLPEDLANAVSQVQELADSYEAILEAIDEAAQAQGVEGTVEQAIQGITAPNTTYAAKKRAEELGVDLSEVEGSGVQERTTRKDTISG